MRKDDYVINVDVDGRLLLLIMYFDLIKIKRGDLVGR